MSHDNFDKDIAELYQQRKQQIPAPEINFSVRKVAKKRRYSLSHMLSILFLGGASSFGILAIISHFSTPVSLEPEISTIGKLRVVELEKEEVIVTDESVMIVLPPLTPKKSYIAPVQFTHEKALKTQKTPTDVVIDLPIDVVSVAAYPTLTQPTLSLVPIYQEQPKYSVKAIKAQQSGSVKLAYNISAEGKVNNIVVVESSVSRELKGSAKKALSKWRYKSNEFNGESYEIIFDFTINKKK